MRKKLLVLEEYSPDSLEQETDKWLDNPEYEILSTTYSSHPYVYAGETSTCFVAFIEYRHVDWPKN